MAFWPVFRLIFHLCLLALVLAGLVALIFLIRYLAIASIRPVQGVPPPAGDRGTDGLSLQLQAYERLVMLAERMSPRQLVRRLAQADSPARELQMSILQVIATEFDHNLSQQVYVSSSAWESICNAREQQVSLINDLTDRLPEGASASELGRSLVLLEGEQGGNYPMQIALTILRAEAEKLLKGHRS